MLFEQDENQQQEDELLPELKNEQMLHAAQTIKFSIITSLFNRLSVARGRKKTLCIRTFLKTLFKHNRNPQFTYSVLRLLLPGDDRQRGNYGVREKNLAIIVRDCWHLSKNQYERLKHYKNPNYHQSGVGIGDFAICLEDVIKGLCNKTSTLTVKELNEILDELVQKDKTQEQVETFRKFYKLADAEEIKWISRIILKDLKLNIKVENVLTTFHPEANDYFNLTNSIKETCKKLENLETSLNDQISLFNPIRPMLAGKKNMKYFSYTSSNQKQYYVQTKYDGERLQVHLENDKIKVFSRNGVDYNHVYEQMLPILKDNIVCDACILDGEIIVLEKETMKMMPFGLNKVTASRKDDDSLQLCYMVFDILWVKVDDQDVNLMTHPLKDRKKLLEKVVKEVDGQLNIVKHKLLSKYDDILREFKEGMDRNQEGIMLKDPDSLYVPKERSVNWLKLKGDYVDGLTDTLDLVILGGYFGNLSYRVGQGGHWSDKVTTFLLGIIEKIDSENQHNSHAIPFCKVGTGYSGDDLQQLRNKLKPFLVQNDGNKKPSFLVGNWKPKIDDRPDCYISSLPNSVILEVKGAELMASDTFGAPVTLRFPRVVKIRYDKDWNQGMRLEDLTNLQNQEKYSKNIRKKRTGSESEEDAQRDDDRPARKKRRDEKIKRQNIIMDEFQCVNIKDENLKSHLFTDMEFYVFHLESSPYTKHEVEKEILLNNGKVIQNPMMSTEYVVADRIDFKLILLEKNHKKSFTFIRPRYIFNCVKSERLLQLSPLYLTILPSDKKTYYLQNYDKYGDSYTSYVDRQELDEILGAMDEKKQNYPIDEGLAKRICLKLRRTGIVSLCFGLDIFQKTKLKMHGNIIVDDYRDQPNSIVIKGQIPPQQVEKLNKYLSINSETQVQHAETLYQQLLL